MAEPIAVSSAAGRHRPRARRLGPAGGVAVPTEDEVLAGLPTSTLTDAAARLGIPVAELLAWLRVAERTWARRKQAGRLDPLESDRMARALRLVQRSVAVTCDEAGARTWLHTPNRALGRRTPFETAGTETGAERVFQLLGRLEHGVVT